MSPTHVVHVLVIEDSLTNCSVAGRLPWIVVLLEGRIMGEVQREDGEVEALGLLMSGVVNS
ncbi:MAG: hypothetical protein ACI91O_000589 [Candidatus Poriferisodalaceae bacterium]|jgi:hypothetical protein